MQTLLYAVILSASLDEVFSRCIADAHYLESVEALSAIRAELCAVILWKRALASPDADTVLRLCRRCVLCVETYISARRCDSSRRLPSVSAAVNISADYMLFLVRYLVIERRGAHVVVWRDGCTGDAWLDPASPEINL